MPLVRARTHMVLPGRRHIATGAVLDSRDPIVAARPDLFAPLSAPDAPTVEQATAAPGETRTTKPRPRKTVTDSE